MQSLRRIIPLCLLGAATIPILAGCGGGGGGGNSGGGGGTLLSASVIAPNGLTVSVAENTSTVAVGGTVTYTLTLTNNTSAAVTVHTGSATAPPAVLHVTNPVGTAVYDTIPPPPLTDVSVAPGQSLTQSVPLSVFATAGAYKTTGSFSFSDGTAATVVGPLTVTAQ